MSMNESSFYSLTSSSDEKENLEVEKVCGMSFISMIIKVFSKT